MNRRAFLGAAIAGMIPVPPLVILNAVVREGNKREAMNECEKQEWKGDVTLRNKFGNSVVTADCETMKVDQSIVPAAAVIVGTAVVAAGAVGRSISHLHLFEKNQKPG